MNAPLADTALARPLLPELRSATRTHHDRIEQLLRLDGTLTLARYRLVISGFHAFLQAWEPAVRQALPTRLQAWFDARGRAQFAAEDMRFLGISECALATPDLSHRLPALAATDAGESTPPPALAAALGSMYVIEGSALGGQVITPRLKQQLNLEPGRGATYFNGYGDRTGVMWRDFRELVEAELAEDAAARQAACHHARRTFDALTQAFEPLLA